MPAALADAKRHARLEKDAKSWLLEQFALELLVLPAHKLRGHPGELESDFRIRAGHLLREKREEALDAVQRQRADLETEAGQETARVAAEYDPQNWTFEKESVRPRSSDTDVKQLALAWIPFAPDSFGAPRPAIEI